MIEGDSQKATHDFRIRRFCYLRIFNSYMLSLKLLGVQLLRRKQLPDLESAGRDTRFLKR